MAKYAKMNGDTVDTISYVPQEGFVEVADTVFAGMVKDVSDNFDYTAERKAETQAVIDAEAQRATDKANAKAKLIAGEALTEAEADTIVL